MGLAWAPCSPYKPARPAHAKICGLSTPEAVEAAVQGGAAYVGFVFFAASPRDVTPARAAELAAPARAAGVQAVAVTVDASDDLLDAITAALAPDLIQLHGGETPERAAAVRSRTGARLIRALRVGEAADLDAATAFEPVADQLMFDARRPRTRACLGATAPPSTGRSCGAAGSPGPGSWPAGWTRTMSPRPWPAPARSRWTFPLAWRALPALKTRLRSGPSWRPSASPEDRSRAAGGLREP